MSKPKEGIVVDGACDGNPGPAEYQVFDLKTGKRLAHVNMGHATNNIAEFVALVHGIALVKKLNLNYKVYSDSRTAISWVKKQEANTSMTANKENVKALSLLSRAESYLKNNNPLDVEVVKWETRQWGENPADFGRKKGGH